MRYFLTTDAARVWTYGGFTFEFEPVRLQGGTWLGILAVDDPAASILAAAHPDGTDEISEEYYNSQKKKGTADQGPAWPRARTPNQAVAVANRVGVPIGQISGSSPSTPVGPSSTAPVTRVTLLTTKASPPSEPLLGGPARSPGRRPF